YAEELEILPPRHAVQDNGSAWLWSAHLCECGISGGGIHWRPSNEPFHIISRAAAYFSPYSRSASANSAFSDLAAGTLELAELRQNKSQSSRLWPHWRTCHSPLSGSSGNIEQMLGLYL